MMRVRLESFPAVVLCLVALAAAAARAQTEYRVLPEDFNADKAQQMMRAFLRRQAHEAFDRRRKQLELALTSAEGIRTYQQQRREFLRWTLGELPPPTPLNPRVTGTIEADGFTLEKLLFESQPGFHVTANVYRPWGKGPFPAILHPCGHSENGKAAAAYQQANQLLARHRFLVLCYDPIGQGERKQIFTQNGTPTQGATGEHQQLGVAPVLLGRSLASYMIWDGVRAIDYLCSRPDVDPQRIGCTGNSGGGNMTSYLMAYDERIAAAAPGCFMTTHRHKNESPGPGDAEQNLFAQIREGFDHPDFILARAPKPTLILCATNDFVPIEGTWEAFRQAKRVYTQLGYPERVGLVEANAKHGFSRSLREGAVRFFARWLQDRHLEAFEEGADSVYPDAQLQVTPHGQVRRMEGERSLLDLYAEYERQLTARRPPLTRDMVRQTAGIRPLEQLAAPRVEIVATNSPRELILHAEPGIVLPALHWPGGSAEPVLIAHDAGMNAAVAEARRLHAAGHPVLLIDVRDSGETKTRNWRFPGADSYIGYMLGRSWLAIRTEDLLLAARWLAAEEGRPKVRLAAYGEIGPSAMHAAALEPELIASLRVDQSLASWRQLMTATDAYAHVHNAVHGVLRHYDLPDLMGLIKP
jgi:dienelactone hydrolase